MNVERRVQLWTYAKFTGMFFVGIIFAVLAQAVAQAGSRSLHQIAEMRTTDFGNQFTSSLSCQFKEITRENMLSLDFYFIPSSVSVGEG